MIRETNIEFDIQVRYGKGARTRRSLKSLQLLEKELARPIKIMSDMIESEEGLDLAHLDSFITEVSTQLRTSYDRNFIQNPPSWPPLSYPTRKVREYKMNPLALKEDMLQAVRPQFTIPGGEEGTETKAGFRKLFGQKIHKGLYERSKYLEQVNLTPDATMDYSQVMERLDRFFNTLKPIRPWKGIVQPAGPALLYTGRLKDSIKPRVVKRQKKTRFDSTFRRTIEFGIAGYGKPLIEGLMTQVAQLSIERVSSQTGSSNVFSFDFYIPNEWVQKFLRFNLGSFYKVTVYWVSVKLPKRDPFLLNEGDAKRIQDITLQYANISTQKFMRKYKQMFYGKPN